MEKIKTKTVISDTIDNWLISTQRDVTRMLKFTSWPSVDATVFGNDFVNTKTRADELYSYLTAQGLKVAKIHGDIAPRERKRIWRTRWKSDFEYIVATDLAAWDWHWRCQPCHQWCHSARFIFLCSPCWSYLEEMAYQVKVATFTNPVMTLGYPWVGEIGNQVYSKMVKDGGISRYLWPWSSCQPWEKTR